MLAVRAVESSTASPEKGSVHRLRAFVTFADKLHFSKTLGTILIYAKGSKS
jgi:hypothetical protein